MRKFVFLFLILSLPVVSLANQEELPTDSSGFTFDNVIQEDQQLIDRYFQELHTPPKSLKQNIKVFHDLKKINDQNKIDHQYLNLQRKFENANLSYPKLKTAPFKAMLKKGSAVFSPSLRKYFNTNYDIVFNTRLSSDNAMFVELLDKKGEVVYETTYENIIPMERDLQILPTPTKFNLYNKTEKTYAHDDVFNLYTKVLLHQELSGDSYFKEVFEQDIKKIENTRLELKPLYWVVDLNFYIGLSAGLLHGRMATEEGRMDFKSLYWGPATEIKLLGDENFFITSGLAFQKSLGFKLRTTYDEQAYKQNILQINLDSSYKIKSGNILVGFVYKYISTTYAGDETSDINSNPPTSSYASVGLSVGFGFNKML